MKDRIKNFMDYKSVSAGELATILDVQRSNISHVLNGRNMPGAAFIEKFLTSFPDLDARWLLTGVGEMINTENRDNIAYGRENPVIKLEEPIEMNKAVNTLRDQIVEKPVEKILVLFTDGTFTDYIKR